jgi:exodeoxyribonuclease VII small subunit
MPKPSAKPPSFEEAVAELETLVAGLEGGQLSLEQSLAAYQRGTELLKLCQKALADAEQQVKILSADGTLKDFQADA